MAAEAWFILGVTVILFFSLIAVVLWVRRQSNAETKVDDPNFPVYHRDPFDPKS